MILHHSIAMNPLYQQSNFLNFPFPLILSFSFQKTLSFSLVLSRDPSVFEHILILFYEVIV